MGSVCGCGYESMSNAPNALSAMENEVTDVMAQQLSSVFPQERYRLVNSLNLESRGTKELMERPELKAYIKWNN